VSELRYIISDENSRHAIPGSNTTGLDLRERVEDAGGFAYSGTPVRPFPEELLIPRHEWQARIEELKERRARNIDLIRHAKLPHKNQGRTNYCWINAPVHCMEIMRLRQNIDPGNPLELSSSWAGSIIKGGRNVGGWGRQAIAFLAEHGTVPTYVCGNNDQSRRHNTAANRRTALQYRVADGFELRPRNLDQMVSLLLRGIPLAGGYNWWGHEVTLSDADWIDNEIAVIIRNSWQGWGDFGFGILQGSRMLADDLVAVSGSSLTGRQVQS
jgi:hypothetical protein